MIDWTVGGGRSRVDLTKYMNKKIKNLQQTGKTNWSTQTKSENPQKTKVAKKKKKKTMTETKHDRRGTESQWYNKDWQNPGNEIRTCKVARKREIHGHKTQRVEVADWFNTKAPGWRKQVKTKGARSNKTKLIWTKTFFFNSSNIHMYFSNVFQWAFRNFPPFMGQPGPYPPWLAGSNVLHIKSWMLL